MGARRECNNLDIAHATQAASERQRNENTKILMNYLEKQTQRERVLATGHGAGCTGHGADKIRHLIVSALGRSSESGPITGYGL